MMTHNVEPRIPVRCTLRSVTVLMLIFFAMRSLQGQDVAHARGSSDPYDALYDVLMTRYGPDGKVYARNEASPIIFFFSKFPFDDQTFGRLDQALDAFAALPQKQVEEYSEIRRALLQRHLWTVFDVTFTPDWRWYERRHPGIGSWETHADRRASVQPKIAALIKRLALTNSQINGLPNTLNATVASGRFAKHHDPADRFKPFLPTDLTGENSSWICLGERRRAIPAGIHTSKLRARSMFLQFMRLPQGRDQTLQYIKRLNDQMEMFPVGTQFALLEQAFLINTDGELTLSPLVVSLQLRAYLNVEQRAREAHPAATQCVAEFMMQPRELINGSAVMRAMTVADHRFELGGPDAAGFTPYDPFETGERGNGMPVATRLNLCMRCHGSKPGVRTKSFRSSRLDFFEVSPDVVSKATSDEKRQRAVWKALMEHWHANSS